MTYRTTKFTTALLAALIAGGCTAKPEAPAAGASRDGKRVIAMAHNAQPPGPDAPRDPPPAQTFVYQVELFRISVPLGTFSTNEDFWKRMDEQCVDVATGNLLFKNGIRVGQAPISELEFFKQFMDAKPNVLRTVTMGADAHRIELEMKTGLPEQTLSVYDHSNVLRMQDYDGCANVINMSFSSTPRRPGAMRLELCPVVRTQRKRFQYTVLNNEMAISYTAPEMLYDLNLEVDISPDKFFIVMPSAEARDTKTSVGRAFLTLEGHVERQEQILLIIQRPIPVEGR